MGLDVHRSGLCLQSGGCFEVAHEPWCVLCPGLLQPGCWHSCTGAQCRLFLEGTVPGDGAEIQRPWTGYNIPGSDLGYSYFANIPHMEEISDRCS